MFETFSLYFSFTFLVICGIGLNLFLAYLFIYELGAKLWERMVQFNTLLGCKLLLENLNDNKIVVTEKVASEISLYLITRNTDE